MRRTLLLNSSWEPLAFISDERAMRLLLKNRAEIISNSDGKKSLWNDASFTTPSRKFDVPATLRLFNRVNRRWKPPRFRKKVLFNRDRWQCQYCGEKLFWNTATIDHVMPSSRGGHTTWVNCVAACKPCNKKKANMTPDEAGFILRQFPKEPSSLHFWDINKCNAWHEDWDLFSSRISE